jgi:hypothetical protein
MGSNGFRTGFCEHDNEHLDFITAAQRLSIIGNGGLSNFCPSYHVHTPKREKVRNKMPY